MKMRTVPVRQQGATLVVVLMLLLIMTLLGLASMRGAILQERMASATFQRAQAFQAAESALRDAESYASTKPAIPSSGCSNGVCVATVPPAAPAWKAASFWTTAGNTRNGSALNGITPKFTLEDYGLSSSSDCAATVGTAPLDMSAPPCVADIRVYKIVARSLTASGSEVMLQSLYRAP